MNCPCCDSTTTRQRRERRQSNGITLGNWRCDACGYSWTTINGRINEKSVKGTANHRAFREWKAVQGDRSRLAGREVQ